MNQKQPDTQSELYVLKHKDLDVAVVLIDSFSGKIDYVLDVYLPDELPAGCRKDGSSIQKWWESRAIPDSRRGIQQVLHSLDEGSNLSLMLSAYGLSLTDHYWMQPIGKELYWKDLNFFENDFSDELGNLLTDSGKVDIDGNISKFSPASSANGEMKKKWVVLDGRRYLMKVNENDYGQQAVNEVIAGKLHGRLGWENYVPYKLETVIMDGKPVPCSLNPLFTSTGLEFVSAYQLIGDYKVPNDSSVYETLIQQAVSYGLQEKQVREHLEYTILTDFILTNTDRHLNNFGFLYDPGKHSFQSMAPIFDTGNALFYNKAVIPSKENLLDNKVTSFCNKEVNLLKYVSGTYKIDFGKLDGFSDEVRHLLEQNTDIPMERAKSIARTVDEKIEYLQLFSQGKKIWKKEKYW